MYIDRQSQLNRLSKSKLLELIETHYTTKELTPIYTDILLPSQHRTLPAKQRITKSLLMKEFDVVFTNPSLGKKFFDAMSQPLQKTLSLLAWVEREELYSLEQTLGFDISILEKSNRYTDPVLFKKGIHWLLFLKTEHCYYDDSDIEWKRCTSVSLPPALRQWLHTFLPKPIGYDLKPIETLPKSTTQEILTYRCDDTLIEDFRITADYILRGNLKFTKSESISKPCIRAVEKLTDSGEFFPNGGVLSKRLPFLRHEIFAGILSVIGNKRLEEMRKDSPDPNVILRDLLASIFGHSEWTHEFILTHLKETYGSSHRPDAATQLTRIFKACGTDGWITLKNLLLHTKFQDLDIEILSQCTTRLKQDHSYGYTYQETIDINPSTVFQFYATSLLQGFPFLLAALGLAEIAYTLPPKNPHYQRGADPFITPFDGFVALRLTPLGNYAFRNTDEIEIKTSTKKRAEIILNPQRLTVVCRNVDPVTELALLEFMEKHSPGCYRLTRQTFMKGCTTAKSVRERIEQFKRNITDELPPLWEEFLTEIESSAIALKAKSGYKIYQLAHSPELKEIFSTDPILLKNTTKVAGLQIAIQKNDLPAVTRRLKTLGYLIG